MALVRHNKIQADASFTSLVTSIVLIEGIGRQLIPDLNLFEVGMPILARAEPKYQQAAINILTELGKQRLSNIWNASPNTDSLPNNAFE
jgi:predicted unusual protein kinase regulating ubiquinone biosynthesis (AarF/ABC1/UbiB family)